MLSELTGRNIKSVVFRDGDAWVSTHENGRDGGPYRGVLLRRMTEEELLLEARRSVDRARRWSMLTVGAVALGILIRILLG